MSVKDDKFRIMVTVSEDMKNRLDRYAEKMGINRSALCAFLLGQGVMSMDKAYGMIDQVTEQWKERTAMADPFELLALPDKSKED